MDAYSTPVRRSPRFLARLLAQPNDENSQSLLGTPQRKRPLQDPVQLQPSKRTRPYSVFLESLVVTVGPLPSLHFDQSYCDDKAVLVVTKARLHEHLPKSSVRWLHSAFSLTTWVEISSRNKDSLSSYTCMCNCFTTFLILYAAYKFILTNAFQMCHNVLFFPFS